MDDGQALTRSKLEHTSTNDQIEVVFRDPTMVHPLNIRPIIATFGDSLTQFGWGVNGQVGWISLLASAYSRRADVLNRGFSGYNTRHALELLPRIFVEDGTTDKAPVLFCTVFFGANDAALPGEPQHVPLDEYRHNLGTIVRHIKDRGVPVILLTPPPVDEDRWMSERETSVPDRRNEVTRNYGSACREVAAAHDCDVVDVFELLGGNGSDYSQHLSDGVHLSGSGNTLLCNALMQLLYDRYPNLAPMSGDGKNENVGIPMEEALWKDLC